MKRLSLLLLLVIFVIRVSGQIMLEHTYPGSATTTRLSLSGDKYYLMDVANNQCKIYNPDHSLWKTISLAVPAGLYLYDIKFVSEELFNSDSKVELAYIYYSYDTTYYYFTYYTKVVNESGYELLSIPGCSYMELKTTQSGATKMLGYVYNYAVYPSTLNTVVYSLPGTIPTGVAEDPAGGHRGAYPNPAVNRVTIPYQIPSDQVRGYVLLYNGLGQMMRKIEVDAASDRLVVQVEGWPRGVYFYQVKSGERLINTGRFVHE